MIIFDNIRKEFRDLAYRREMSSYRNDLYNWDLLIISSPGEKRSDFACSAEKE